MNGSATLKEGCNFTSNTSNYWGGGAYFFTDVKTTLTNCTFTTNHAKNARFSKGGGAYFRYATTLTNCNFTGNTSLGVEADDGGGNGGGAYFYSGDNRLTGCTFKGNTTTSNGAGSYFNGSAGLTDCTFTGNEADVGAGGSYFRRVATLKNCVVVGNTATNNAGGLWLNAGGTVINSTLYNNMATDARATGGGIRVQFEDNNPFTLQNSILLGNTVTDVAFGYQVFVFNADATNVVNIQNNLIAGDADPLGTDQGVVYETPGSANITQTGTVDASDATVVFASTTAADVYYLRLVTGSPALNVGNNDYVNNASPPITTDAVGAVRIQAGTVDLGAYEGAFAAPIAQVITFTSPDTGVVGTEITLAATGGASGLPITFMITGGTGTATLADGSTTLRLMGVGTVEVTATQAGTAIYAVVTKIQTITVKKTQDIMFTSDDAGFVGTDIELMATASSGLDVTFAVTEGNAFAILGVNGTTLSLIGAGTVTITATQAGNADYEGAMQTQDITVSKQMQTIVFMSDVAGDVGVPIILAATASSGLDVTFAITEEFKVDGTTLATDGTVATLADDGTTLRLTGVGEVVITATQAGNASYVAATQAQTITVSQGMQTIRFTSDAAGVIETDIELVAMASSGLDVTFMITAETLPDGSAATTGEVATLSSTTLSLISVGKVTITATQAGNANYAATTQTQEIAVSATPLTSQTITFTSTGAGNVGVPITLMATATSTLPVIFAITTQTRTTGTGDVATLDIGTGVLTLVSPGEVTITATQTGGDSGGTIYAAIRKTQIITVSKGIQVITFSDPSDNVTRTIGETISLEATTGVMGLFVTFAIVTTPMTGVATLTDNGMGDGMGSLTLDGEGTVTVTASQGGNDTYVAAPDMTRTITVIKQTQTIDFTLADNTGDVGDDIALVATASSGLDVSFVIAAELLPDGSAATAGAVATLLGTTLTLTGRGDGDCYSFSGWK